MNENKPMRMLYGSTAIGRSNYLDGQNGRNIRSRRNVVSTIASYVAIGGLLLLAAVGCSGYKGVGSFDLNPNVPFERIKTGDVKYFKILKVGNVLPDGRYVVPSSEIQDSPDVLRGVKLPNKKGYLIIEQGGNFTHNPILAVDGDERVVSIPAGTKKLVDGVQIEVNDVTDKKTAITVRKSKSVWEHIKAAIPGI